MALICCRKCDLDLPPESYTPHGLKRRWCKTCARDQCKQGARGTEARRLFSCVTAALRRAQAPELSYWKLSDVEELLGNFEQPEFDRPVKLRIIRCDPKQPFLPCNSKIICAGQRTR